MNAIERKKAEEINEAINSCVLAELPLESINHIHLGIDRSLLKVLYNNQKNFVDLLRISAQTDEIDVKGLLSFSQK